MRKNKNVKNLLLSLTLAGVMSVSATTGILPNAAKVFALDTSSTVTYPYATGEDAFKYSPTFKMQLTQTSTENWEFIQAKFKATDFVSTDYLAVQIKIKNYCQLTTGVLDGADRFTSISGGKAYFLHENGTLEAKAFTSGNEIVFGNNECGTLLLPMSQLKYQFLTSNNGLKDVTLFYMTANSQYYWGYEVTIGNIGVYHGDPSVSGTAYETLLDVTTTAHKNDGTYYVASQNPDALTFPADSNTPPPVVETAPEFAYPYRTGDNALINGGRWIGPAAGSSVDNFHQLNVNFDNADVDLSSAKYMVVEIYNKTAAAPGITFGLLNGTDKYGFTGDKDGSSVWKLVEGETVSTKAANTLYSSANVPANFKGALIIPVAAFANGDFTAMDGLYLETNSKYNYAFDLVVGEVGYLDSENNYTELLSLDSGKKDAKYSASSTVTTDPCTLDFMRAPREMMGDSTIDFTCTGKNSASFDIWTGGSYGTATMTTDTYGDAAVQLKATGTNPDGDGYVATTLSGAGGWSWAERKGVSFWARNDSNVEVSFNLEIDCKYDEYTPYDANGDGDYDDDGDLNGSNRFNVGFGKRFYLYDVNTGKTTIYVTRPVVSIPVGFEGWIYVPFTAFKKADWSNKGLLASDFMATGTHVSYLAITVHAATYLDKSFSVNKFGAYATTPSFESSYVTSENTIHGLLGLDEQA